MATQATHIILTDKVYKEYFGDCDKKDFFLGTLLPDIRYLDKTISKESTHKYNITLKEIKSLSNCFEQGIYFHSLLDRVRDNFYISRGIYSFGGDEYFIAALKLLEDQYLYDKINNRSEYLSFLDQVPYQKRPDIKEESLYKWFILTKGLIVNKPNTLSRNSFMKAILLPDNYINTINDLVDKLQKDKKILNLIDELYDTFETLINDN